MNADRRHFLTIAALVPFAGLAASRALADATACYDPASLPFSQKGMRRSLQFVAVAPDPSKHCGLCSFYSQTKSGCGTCQLLSGPVEAASFCASYAPKAK